MNATLGTHHLSLSIDWFRREGFSGTADALTELLRKHIREEALIKADLSSPLGGSRLPRTMLATGAESETSFKSTLDAFSPTN